jgi:hypothetical protein
MNPGGMGYKRAFVGTSGFVGLSSCSGILAFGPFSGSLELEVVI